MERKASMNIVKTIITLVVFFASTRSLVAKQAQGNKPVVGVLSCHTHRTYEPGDCVDVELMSESGPLDIRMPIPVRLRLYKPDDAIVEKKVSLINCRRQGKLGCDPIPFTERLLYDFRSDLLRSSPVGLYRITGFSEGNALTVKGCHFFVIPSRLESLFLPKNIGTYTLNWKKKECEPGAFSAEYEMSDEHAHLWGRINVKLTITDSPEAARQYYNQLSSYLYPPLEMPRTHPAAIVEAGQALLFNTQRDSFVALWPSGKYLIFITTRSWSNYGHNENEVLREFLKKYPSSLKP